MSSSGFHLSSPRRIFIISGCALRAEAATGIRHLSASVVLLALWALVVPLVLIGTTNAAEPELDTLRVTREHDHTGQVVYLHHDRQRNQFVSIDNTGKLFVWDALTYRQVSTARKIPFPVAKATYISDRTHLIFGADGRVALLNLDTQAEPRTISRIEGVAIAVSPPLNGERIRVVTYHEKELRVVEIDRTGSLRQVHQLQVPLLTNATLSPDAQWLAVATATSELSLIDLNSGQLKWQRFTEAPLTFIRVGEHGTMIGAYDNLIAYKLKRIDQFDLATGVTTRSIETAPCSVLQIEILDDNRGFAICGASVLDHLHVSAGPVSWKFLTWSFSSADAPSSIPVPNLSLLPFPTGVMLLKTDHTVIVGGGSGALYAARLNEKGFMASILRLVPLPTRVARFVTRSGGKTLLALSPFWGTGTAEKDESSEIRKRRGAAFASLIGSAGPLSPDEVADEGNGLSLRPNRLALWDMTSPMLMASRASALGFLEDASIDEEHISVVERVLEAAGTQSDSVAFAVSQVSDEDGTLSKTRPISFDFESGLLVEGVNRRSDSQDKYFASCPGATGAGIARLSGDNTMMIAVCMVLNKEEQMAPAPAAQQKAPTYALFTFPLSNEGSTKPARILIPGIPQQFELSRDGKIAAVFVTTRIGDPLVEGDGGEYELVIINTHTGSIVSSLKNLVSPPTGRGLAFTSQGEFLFVALGRSVYRYRLDDRSFEPILSLPQAETRSISSLAIDMSASRIAVSTYGGVTKIYTLSDGKKLAELRHPGEVITQLLFYGIDTTRLIASSDTSGVSMLDYATGERIADYLSYSSDAWSVSAPTGVFSASIGGEQGITISSGDRAVAIDQLYDQFFRPDLLARRIASGESALVPTDVVRKALAQPPPVVEVELGADHVHPVAAISVRDTGGGIGGLRLFHNGKLARSLSVAELPKEKVESKGDRVSISIPLPVAAGTNEYLITALNAPGTVQGRFARVVLDEVAESQPRRAFLITLGINDFDKGAFPSLKLAERSATKVNNALREILIGIVGVKQVNEIMLIGSAGKRQSVEAALQRIESDARPDDIIAIVITTHGKILPSGELIVAAQDTRPDGEQGLTASRLLESMNRSQALTQVLVLDICHAGAVPERLSSIYQERFAVFAGQAGIHVLAATSQNETALAEFDDTTPFAHFLLARLREPASTPGVQRSLRKIAEAAADDTRTKAKELGFSQAPNIYSFGRDLRFP